MDLNKMVSYSLRVGVLASAVLSLAGLALWAIEGFKVLGPSTLLGIPGIVGFAISGDAASIIYLAVILLIATPIFRVAVSSVYFAAEKDERYVGITLLVLAMLIFALFSAFGA